MVNTGLDKRRSMLRSKRGHQSHRSSISHPNDQTKVSALPATKDTTSISLPSSQTDNNGKPSPTSSDINDGESDSRTELTPPSSSRKSSQDPQADIDALTKDMAALKFIPRSIRFGRGGGKAGLARS